MKTRNSILAAGAALLMSTCDMAKPKHADKPVPPVPADVREKGADAVVDWMLEKGFLTPEALCAHTGEKARSAADGMPESPLIAQLHSGYDSLPDTAFMVGIKPTWESVAAKLTPDVLATASKLESPKIYGVNGEGELLIGDGGKEVPSFTLMQDYSTARSDAKAKGLSLMTVGEYLSFNNTGMMESGGTHTWLESGEAPADASIGLVIAGVIVGRSSSRDSRENLGARRVLRVKL